MIMIIFLFLRAICPQVRNFADNFSQYLMWQQQLGSRVEDEMEPTEDKGPKVPAETEVTQDENGLAEEDADSQTSFEMVVLEGILRFVCDKYDRRMRCFRPVSSNRRLAGFSPRFRRSFFFLHSVR